MDLAERDPVAALEWCRLLGKTPSTILVAGGDGTIAWLLNTINKLELKVYINSFFFFFLNMNHILPLAHKYEYKQMFLYDTASSVCSNNSFGDRQRFI